MIPLAIRDPRRTKQAVRPLPTHRPMAAPATVLKPSAKLAAVGPTEGPSPCRATYKSAVAHPTPSPAETTLPAARPPPSNRGSRVSWRAGSSVMSDGNRARDSAELSSPITETAREPGSASREHRPQSENAAEAADRLHQASLRNARACDQRRAVRPKQQSRVARYGM